MDYFFFILTIVSVWAMLSISANLVLGYTGLFTVGHVGYLAAGAYIAAILNILLGVNYYLAIPLALAGTAVFALLTLLPLLRLGPFHFGLATLGLNVVIVDVIHNTAPRVAGAEGLFGLKLPPPIDGSLGRCLVCLAALAACALLAWWIVSSPFGRSLRATRDDPAALASLGKNPDRYRIAIWTVSGAIAGLAGSLYATTLFYIDPTVFVVTFSFFLLVYIGVGGLASIVGSILGPLILILFNESLRFTGLPSDFSGPTQQMLYGLLLVVLMLFRRQGLVGKYEFHE
ncbi:MAG TPA: branched-chain amino acid ABC transporter permease [Chloroflexota bacterium]|nr:branched-chain amino acid ABC transporter permease [Chloroflexota bacterium]